MIELIKKYWQLGVATIIATFVFLFWKRGQTIKDLRHDVLEANFDKQSSLIKESLRQKKVIYEKTIKDYLIARELYVKSLESTGRNTNQSDSDFSGHPS